MQEIELLSKRLKTRLDGKQVSFETAISIVEESIDIFLRTELGGKAFNRAMRISKSLDAIPTNEMFTMLAGFLSKASEIANSKTEDIEKFLNKERNKQEVAEIEFTFSLEEPEFGNYYWKTLLYLGSDLAIDEVTKSLQEGEKATFGTLIDVGTRELYSGVEVSRIETIWEQI